jgi:hypothetical protein
VGLRALTSVGLVGTLHEHCLLEATARGLGAGIRAGGGAHECTGARCPGYNASAVFTGLPLVAHRGRWYVSAPRGATAGRRGLPRLSFGSIRPLR